MKRKCFILLCLMLMLPLVALAEPFTVENDTLLLTIDDQTLDMVVTDKATGLTIASGVDASSTSANAAWQGFLGSTLVLEVTSGTSTTAQRVDMHTATPTIGLIPVENGVDAVIDFAAQGQRMTLAIRLEGDSVALTVPADSIEEYGDTKLCGLFLTPAFGATHLADTEGYMLVPEAAGALINFSNGVGIGTTPYSKRVYGNNIGVQNIVTTRLNRDPEEVTLPVFGLAQISEGIGYLGVIEQGAEASEIMAYPGGVITEFNWVAARFILREEYLMQTTRTEALRSRESNAYLRDMSVRYYILTGEDADYSGMAMRYRKALEDQGALADGDTTYRPRLDFLGAESEKFLLWDALVPMTTIEQASDILDAYMEAGLTSPLVIYRGWQSGGLSKNYGSGDIGLERKLGKRDDLKALRERIEALGGGFMLEMDPVTANPNRLYNMRIDIVRTIGQTVASIATGKDLYPAFYYLTPNRTREIMNSFRQTYGDDFNGLALATMPNVLYSYFSNGSNHMRGETAADYQAAMEAMDGFTLALENPLACYFGDMDIYLDMPLGTTSYSFLSAEVPFLPMVLSGHVPYYATWANFDANQQKQLLKMLEYGAYPSWLLTGEAVQKLSTTNSSDVFTAQWDVLLKTVVNTDQIIRDVQQALTGLTMVRHDVPGTNLACVTYSDGTRLLINYRSTNAMIDGHSVPAMGYLLVEGGDAR